MGGRAQARAGGAGAQEQAVNGGQDSAGVGVTAARHRIRNGAQTACEEMPLRGGASCAEWAGTGAPGAG